MRFRASDCDCSNFVRFVEPVAELRLLRRCFTRFVMEVHSIGGRFGLGRDGGCRAMRDFGLRRASRNFRWGGRRSRERDRRTRRQFGLDQVEQFGKGLGVARGHHGGGLRNAVVDCEARVDVGAVAGIDAAVDGGRE
jgi:hypothetical protein